MDIIIKIKIWIGAANSIDPGQTAQMLMMAWLYASGKALYDLPLAC